MNDSCLTSKSVELYEVDFYKWTIEQAKFLREEKWNCLDVPNLLEEIEALGRQERREVKSRLGILLGHLLKWQFQPEARSKSWALTIREQRSEVLELIEESPSLKPYLMEAVKSAYQKGLNLAAKETTLDYEDFPQECPYSLEQILNPDFPLNPNGESGVRD